MSSPIHHSPLQGLMGGLFLAGTVAVGLTGCNRTPAPEVPVPAKTASTTAPKSGSAATPSAPKTASGTAASSKTPGAAAAPTAGAKTGSAASGRGSSGAPGSRRSSESEKERARQSAAEMVPVETALVTRGPISAFLVFNTTLETEAAVDIYPQTTGQVEALLAEEGRIVAEGEPLLKIEDRELRIDMDEAAANFEQLQRNFTRTEDLYARKLINNQDYETQRNALELARLRHERAKMRHAYTTVRAPFAGVITARESQVGARVTASSKLFSMVKLDDIVAKVYVPGRYLPIVAENQPVVVTSEFLPDRSFTGWVKRISPVIDPKSGTFKVTVGVRGERPKDLPPGLFVNVRVITDTRPSAVLIPKKAMIYEGGERYVFAVVNDRAVKRKLAPGYEDPVNIEALSGFKPGDPVIVLGQSGLKDGSLVRSVNKPLILPASPAGPGAGSASVPAAATAPAPTSSAAPGKP